MKRVNWTAVGFVVWTIAFVELFVLIFLPTIRLWLAHLQPMYHGGPPVLVILVAVGIVGLVVGVSIIRRNARGPHDGPDRWRSHRR